MSMDDSWGLLSIINGDIAIKEAHEYLTKHAQTDCSDCPVSKIDHKLLDMALNSGAKYRDVPIDQLEQVAMLLDILMFHLDNKDFNFITVPVFGKIELENINELHRHIYRRHVMAKTIDHMSFLDAMDRGYITGINFYSEGYQVGHILEIPKENGDIYCHFKSTHFGVRVWWNFNDVCTYDIRLYLADNNDKFLSYLDIPHTGIITYRSFYGGSVKLGDELRRIGEMARNNFTQ